MEPRDPKENPPPQTTPDLIPAPIRALIALFDGPLRDVRFPDVDGAALGELVAQAEAQVSEVLAAEQMLAQARKTLEDKLDVLNQKAHRALSYAKVFAEDDLPLRAEIANILLPKARRGAGAPGIGGQGTRTTPVPGAVASADGGGENEGTPAPAKRRGRPRKIDVAAGEAGDLGAGMGDGAHANGANGTNGTNGAGAFAAEMS